MKGDLYLLSVLAQGWSVAVVLSVPWPASAAGMELCCSVLIPLPAFSSAHISAELSHTAGQILKTCSVLWFYLLNSQTLQQKVKTSQNANCTILAIMCSGSQLWLDPESKQSHPSSWAKLCKAQNKPGHVSGTSTFGLAGHHGGALFWQQICNLNFLGGSLVAQFQPGQPPPARFGLGRVGTMGMRTQQQELCPTGCDPQLNAVCFICASAPPLPQLLTSCSSVKFLCVFLHLLESQL